MVGNDQGPCQIWWHVFKGGRRGAEESIGTDFVNLWIYMMVESVMQWFIKLLNVPSPREMLKSGNGMFPCTVFWHLFWSIVCVNRRLRLVKECSRSSSLVETNDTIVQLYLLQWLQNWRLVSCVNVTSVKSFVKWYYSDMASHQLISKSYRHGNGSELDISRVPSRSRPSNNP